MNEENHKPSFFRSCLDCIRPTNGYPSRHPTDLFQKFSLAWKCLIVLFTIILLFGSPLQFLFTEKEADSAFDILYISALVVFILDMILNSYNDPTYFGFSLCHRNRVQPFDRPKFCSHGIGSFKMWCDMVSTATLFYDISYTSPFQYNEEVLELTLDRYGLPVSCCDDYMRIE